MTIKATALEAAHRAAFRHPGVNVSASRSGDVIRVHAKGHELDSRKRGAIVIGSIGRAHPASIAGMKHFKMIDNMSEDMVEDAVADFISAIAYDERAAANAVARLHRRRGRIVPPRVGHYVYADAQTHCGG